MRVGASLSKKKLDNRVVYIISMGYGRAGSLNQGSLSFGTSFKKLFKKVPGQDNSE